MLAGKIFLYLSFSVTNLCLSLYEIKEDLSELISVMLFVSNTEKVR